MALLVHAPSAIVCDVAPGRHVLKTAFGLMAEAYERGETDGVSFTVALREGKDEVRVLFGCTLDPEHDAADRGSIPLELEFENALPAQLVLRTDTGPRQNSEYDWAYWCAIELR
jgi:hypothetical protein